VDIALSPSPAMSQHHGFVHAGAVASIADSVAGYADPHLEAPGAGVLTAEFKFNLLAPTPDDRIVANGRIVRVGRTLTLGDDVFAER
jgi:uncharacterized protein (TIGR00369 family)